MGSISEWHPLLQAVVFLNVFAAVTVLPGLLYSMELTDRCRALCGYMRREMEKDNAGGYEERTVKRIERFFMNPWLALVVAILPLPSIILIEPAWKLVQRRVGSYVISASG